MFYSVATRPSRNFSPAARSRALDRFLVDTLAAVNDRSPSKSATIEDLETTYTLQLDVPGLTKEQLDIDIEGDVVRVSSKEGAARSVKAAWRFPLEIDTATSKAKLENGVLSLTLGKKVPVSNVTQLTIA